VFICYQLSNPWNQHTILKRRKILIFVFFPGCSRHISLIPCPSEWKISSANPRQNPNRVCVYCCLFWYVGDRSPRALFQNKCVKWRNWSHQYISYPYITIMSALKINTHNQCLTHNLCKSNASVICLRSTMFELRLGFSWTFNSIIFFSFNYWQPYKN